MRQQLDVDGERCLVEIDRPSARLLDAPADFALHLRRRHRKSLVRAPHADAKAAARSLAEVVEDRPCDGVDVERGSSRVGKVRDAERPPHALARRLAAGAWTELNLDAPHQRAHGDDIEVRKRPPQIADKPAEEPRTVLPLERDLLVVDDDRIHQVAAAAAM